MAIRVALIGTGNCGSLALRQLIEDDRFDLTNVWVSTEAKVGKDAGEVIGMPCKVLITTDVEAAIAQADCLIDFTRPQGTLAHVALCRKHKTAMVIGTTGIEEEGKKVIAEAAFRYENLFIRADIFKIDTQKKEIELHEVKAKSYSSTDNFMSVDRKLGDTTGIKSGWESYLFDVAFQKYVLRKCFPDYKISIVPGFFSLFKDLG